VSVSLRRRGTDAAEAEALRAALAADNPSYVDVTAHGPELNIRLTAKSASSARATLEDLMACLQVAEQARRAGASEPR
jgi:uncharacterized protein with PIN domain